MFCLAKICASLSTSPVLLMEVHGWQPALVALDINALANATCPHMAVSKPAPNVLRKVSIALNLVV